MLTYGNIVGNQDDWANYITNVDMRETPFMDWLPVGNKPVNVLYQYQADKYANPRVNAHVDAKPWQNFNSAGDNRGELKALVQWFDNTTSASKLSQDVSNAAGVADELARDIPKRLKEMGRDMEVQFLGDCDCIEGTTNTAYRTRGVGSWIASSAQTLYPVPTAFLTPSDSINTSLSTTTITENSQQAIMQSIGTTTGSSDPITLWAGATLKRSFAQFTGILPTTAVGGATPDPGKPFTQSATSKKIVRVVDYYQGDFGPVEIVWSPWNAWMTSATAVASSAGAIQNGRGYYLHRSKWQLRWNQKPQVYKPEFKGGSYEAAMDAIVMLVCLNPQGEGKVAPSS